MDVDDLTTVVIDLAPTTLGPYPASMDVLLAVCGEGDVEALKANGDLILIDGVWCWSVVE